MERITITKLLVFFIFALCFASEDAYKITCEGLCCSLLFRYYRGTNHGFLRSRWPLVPVAGGYIFFLYHHFPAEEVGNKCLFMLTSGSPYIMAATLFLTGICIGLQDVMENHNHDQEEMRVFSWQLRVFLLLQL